MKMDDIVAILKECSHGVPKFLCRRCSPKSAPDTRGGMSSDNRWGTIKPKRKQVARYKPVGAIGESDE